MDFRDRTIVRLDFEEAIRRFKVSERTTR